MPRSRLGPLAIESKLGDHPSTSSVWRAVHVQHKKAVAVKLFGAPFGGTPEARQSFASEWERLKELSHPGIAKCYGGGFEDSDAYLAFELIEGETMSCQLERTGRLSWENTLDLAQGLIEALEFLHSKGIVHGAIAPDKVVVAGFSPVLLDIRSDRFGSPFRSTRPPTIEQVARQAPELVAPGVSNPADYVTASADLYAFGSLLYHAITGRLPVGGETLAEVRLASQTEVPPSPASIVLECPIWFDKLIMQLLEKTSANRPLSATAVKLSLIEVRKRALSRAGVAEHVSSGFSPLQVTSQKEKDEARSLLGRGVIDLDQVEDEEDEIEHAIVWHDQPWLLFGGLFLLLAFMAYIAWPASEESLRARAEKLIAQDTRTALAEAENEPLRQLINRFPEGQNAVWAQEQIDRIDVIQFLHQLSIKIKNKLPINDQGELLHKQAQMYAENGDNSQAIDKYRSMVTVLGDDPEYEVAVNAARYQIAILERKSETESDAAKIIQSRLEQAEQLLAENRVVEAKKIWYSLVELYGDNSDVQPLIEKAQKRLIETD